LAWRDGGKGASIHPTSFKQAEASNSTTTTHINQQATIPSIATDRPTTTTNQYSTIEHRITMVKLVCRCTPHNVAERS